MEDKKEKKMEKRPNIIRFEFIDNTHLDEFNETCKMEKQFYGEREDGQVITIEDFFYYCRDFAAAMGFAEGTIDEWFEC